MRKEKIIRLRDSEYVALNSDGKIIAHHKNPEIAKAEAIIKKIYSPFIIPVIHLEQKAKTLNETKT